MEKGEIKNKALKVEIENKEETAEIVALRPLHYRGKNYGIGVEMVVDVETMMDLVSRQRATRKNDGQ